MALSRVSRNASNLWARTRVAPLPRTSGTSLCSCRSLKTYPSRALQRTSTCSAPRSIHIALARGAANKSHSERAGASRPQRRMWALGAALTVGLSVKAADEQPEETKVSAALLQLVQKDSERLIQWWYEDMTPENPMPKNNRWYGQHEDEYIIKTFGPISKRLCADSTELHLWLTLSMRTRVALVVLMDQMHRNMYRGDALSFEYDELMQEAVLELLAGRESFPSKNSFATNGRKQRIDKLADEALHNLQESLEKASLSPSRESKLPYRNLEMPMYSTLLMPLMHSEYAKVQEVSCKAQELFLKDLAASPYANSKILPQSLSFAEKHKEIVDRFGRFPKRNEVLNREDTKEEKEYLSEIGDRAF